MALQLNQRYAKAGFYAFLISYSILPLSFPLISPLLLSIYAMGVLYFFSSLKSSWNWEEMREVNRVILVLVAIYLVDGPYSLMQSAAEPRLVLKDSVGFLFYPAYFFLAAVIVAGYISQDEWERFLVLLGVAISVFHFASFVAFYHWKDVLTNVTLFETNYFLRNNIGAASKYATGNGLLRVDSSMGTLLVIPMMIAFRKIISKKDPCRNHLLMAVFSSGLLLEGHRALFVAVSSGLLLYLLWFGHATRELKVALTHGTTAAISMVAGVLITVALLGSYLNVTSIAERFSQTVDRIGSEQGGSVRIAQIRPLIAKIAESPFFGSGFGAHASLVRNTERPYMYEMDYLAIVMKLGLLGAVAYFGAYLYLLYSAWRMRTEDRQVMSYVFAGVAFLIYAGTNGGMAMSIYSTLFHLYLMLGLSLHYHQLRTEV